METSQTNSNSKLIVRNLPFNATHVELTNYFEKYGKLQDCVVVMDKVTGKSRGFGFIKFEDEQDADDVVNKTHIIGGRQIDCKRAVLSPQAQSKWKEVAEKTNRIKITNLSYVVEDEEFKEYFGKFGKVEDFERINDIVTGEFKGSAYVTFENDETVESIMKQMDELKIGDRKVLCLKVPRGPPKETERED